LYFTSNLYFLSNMSKNVFSGKAKRSVINTGIEPVAFQDLIPNAHP
jgi:hypothetical protein